MSQQSNDSSGDQQHRRDAQKKSPKYKSGFVRTLNGRLNYFCVEHWLFSAIFILALTFLGSFFQLHFLTATAKTWLVWGLILIAFLFCLAALHVVLKPTMAVDENPPSDMISPPDPLKQSIDPASIRPDDVSTVIRIPPRELVAHYAHHTSVQADKLLSVYIGKWYEVSGLLGDVVYSHGNLLAYFNSEYHKEQDCMVSMSFSKEWLDRITIVPRGTHLKVIGRIQGISALFISLVDCRIV